MIYTESILFCWTLSAAQEVKQPASSREYFTFYTESRHNKKKHTREYFIYTQSRSERESMLYDTTSAESRVLSPAAAIWHTHKRGTVERGTSLSFCSVLWMCPTDRAAAEADILAWLLSLLFSLCRECVCRGGDYFSSKMCGGYICARKYNPSRCFFTFWKKRRPLVPRSRRKNNTTSRYILYIHAHSSHSLLLVQQQQSMI